MFHQDNGLSQLSAIVTWNNLVIRNVKNVIKLNLFSLIASQKEGNSYFAFCKRYLISAPLFFLLFELWTSCSCRWIFYFAITRLEIILNNLDISNGLYINIFWNRCSLLCILTSNITTYFKFPNFLRNVTMKTTFLDIPYSLWPVIALLQMMRNCII